MKKWADEISEKIDVKLEGTREKEIRFFRIDEFKRNITRIETFSTSCPFCEKQKTLISAAADKIDEAIHVPGKERREYDRLISRISRHMQKEHDFYTPFHFAYLFSFFGMIAGLLLGYILQKLIPEYNWAMLALGFSAGLITGYIWGNIKDKKIRSAKKLM